LSIRLKLLLSYAAMLVVPLLSILLLTALMIVLFQGNLQNVKSIYESTEERFDHEAVEHIAKEIKRSIERQPELLQDRTYLDEMTAELQKTDSSLVVRVDHDVIYRSPAIGQVPDLQAQLPPFKGEFAFTRYPLKKLNNADYRYLQFDFDYPGIGQGTVFVVSKIDPVTYFIREYFPTLFAALLLIMIATNIFVTMLMSKRIIRPLHALRKAASEIKDGNLDFKLQVTGKDEIGQLGVAFEEMRSRLQQSLQVQAQYEENRKELIANISHDLRTPLTAIRGYIDGLIDGIADTPEKNMKYVLTIAKKSEELDHLINELFLYSKLDLNRNQFQFEAVHLLPFLEDWADELQFELGKRSISFQADIRLFPATVVLLDRDHFKRVLNNIVQNSVRYMDKDDPVIRLKAYCEGDAAVLELADNGTGIAPDALQHIFERFYRADESRNANTGGSGLGLAIAKQIMAGHGGTIHASSKQGTGTTITLAIPISAGA